MRDSGRMGSSKAMDPSIILIEERLSILSTLNHLSISKAYSIANYSHK
jgi:hypothetical protein